MRAQCQDFEITVAVEIGILESADGRERQGDRRGLRSAGTDINRRPAQTVSHGDDRRVADGLELGRPLGTRVGRRGELVSGLVLVAVGAAMAAGVL